MHRNEAAKKTPKKTAPTWCLSLPRGRSLELGGEPRIMGILNLTPDSFSDGGQWLDPEKAVEHGLAMVEQGADLLDLGAESSRPGGGVYGTGAAEVSAEEELERLLPVLEGLRAQTEIPLSIDTRKGEVASRALAAGADLINDVTALSEPDLARAVRECGCPLVLMHSRGHRETMQAEPHYDDLSREVRTELGAAMDRATAFGIARDQLILDPGLGYAKAYRHSLALLARLGQLAGLGRPLMVGASRKSFIGHLTGGAPPDDRLAGSLAAASAALAAGAVILRVHDVADTARFLAVREAVIEAGGATP